MEKAEDDLRSRGFVEEPDGVIVVEFEQDAPRFGVLDWILPAVHAQTVNVSGGNRGRVVWSAWNDGDNRTWEGNITGQSYTYSAYSSANMQFDVASRTWAPHTLWHAMQGAASTCATAGAVCAAFGPGYFNCLASACIGAFAKGLIDEMSAWAHECNRRCVWTSVSAGVYECV